MNASGALPIVIIGAGVTGLTAAHALRKAGRRVVVLERSGRTGGVIASTRRDGFLVESGPNTMLLNDAALLEFFRELGLADELLEASPQAAKRYIVRGGKPVAAPMSLPQFIRTPLLSGGAKWRLLREPFVPRASDAEESVASFTRRRLGPEVLDYAINPLMGGIYAGDPERLSLRYAFPKLHAFDQEHGSLVRGAIAAARARKRSGKPRFKSRSISFRDGLQAITDALAQPLGDSLRLNTNVEAISPAGKNWRVRFARAGEPATELAAAAVIVAIPAYAVASLPLAAPGAADRSGAPLAALDEVEYPPVTSLALGYRREQIAHPLDGYGALVPQREGRRILGTLFNSSLFAGRAPGGCVLLTTFVGGMRQPEIARLPLAELRAVVRGDLDDLFGVSGEPCFEHVTAWPRAIPQYNLGYGRFHAAMRAAEEQLPGLLIGGNCRDGASVGDCIRSGWRLAERARAW